MITALPAGSFPPSVRRDDLFLRHHADQTDNGLRNSAKFLHALTLYSCSSQQLYTMLILQISVLKKT